MGKTRPRTIVLDTGALIAFERGDAKMRTLVREALKTKTRVVIPAGVLGHGAQHRAGPVTYPELAEEARRLVLHRRFGGAECDAKSSLENREASG